MSSAESLTATSNGLPFAADRRRHTRVEGPFDGWRVAAIETAVRFYDLCEGGCFVNSLHETPPGLAMSFRIDLPGEGTVTVDAETLARKDQLGFAVKFVRISEEDAARLERCLDALRDRSADED
jgi:hypothetical protein